MLPWKLRKRQCLPVNQNLPSVHFSLAKFQLVSSNLSLAMIWQMTHNHKLPKLCSATLSELLFRGYLLLRGHLPKSRKSFPTITVKLPYVKRLPLLKRSRSPFPRSNELFFIVFTSISRSL